MKKVYLKPEIEVLKFEFEAYMLSSSDTGIEDGGDTEDPGITPTANRHRGEWGNLWSED